ncbi:MAG: type II toxin-antitoxin system RelE/ParE family toxin [Muribaculaceae bacterium]|nr:type II toxin-antitoxin system RelE/ParE family toxin [Muribaculaceae bacterium]
MKEEPLSKEKPLRTIIRTKQFDEFYFKLPRKVQTKFDYVMNVIINIYDIPTKFIKHLQNTDLYEMRVSVGPNEYRTVVFAIDHDNVIQASKVILLNGFIKKSTKDYIKEIETANKILDELLS